MDPNSPRTEAERWIGISEKLLASRDLVGSRSFAIRARESDPTNPISDQILTVVETLMAAEKRVINSGNYDWYSILQLPHLVRDPDLIASHYRRLVLLLNPEQNHLPYAEFAIRVVFDAWSVLSDPAKKWMYDSELSIFLQRTSDPEPVRVDTSSSGAATYQFFHQPPPTPPPQQQHQQQQWIHHLHQQEQPQAQLQERQLFQQQHTQPQPPPPQSQWLSQTHSQLLPEQQRRFPSQWLPQQHLAQAPSPQQPPLRPPQWLPEQHRPVSQQQTKESQFPPQLQRQQLKEPQIPAQLQRQQPVKSQIPPQLQRQQPEETQIPPQSQRQQPKEPQIPPQLQRQQPKSQLQPQEQQQKHQNKTAPPPAPAQTTPPHRPLQQTPQTQELQKENNVRSKEDGIGRLSDVANGKATDDGNTKNDCNDSANVIENENNHDGGVHAESFWTACPYCYYLYEYYKAFQECTLRCQNCRRAFQAVQIQNPPAAGDKSPFCSWGFFPIGFSMASWKKSAPNANGLGSNWVPFSPMFACPMQQGVKTKKWTILDASDDDLDVSSDDSDSSCEWGSNRKKVKRANGRSKKGRPGRPSNAEREKTANQHSVNGENSQFPSNNASSKKQAGKGVRGRKKLDLNVEFSNEVDDHSALPRDGNGEEVGFFEGLDEFLSTLPILDVDGDDKAKPS